ncbi:MAG: hypothetical protein ACK5LP_10675 [Campylobacteraceae bacterium]
MNKKFPVLVVVDIDENIDIKAFEGYLLDEGFEKIKDEPFAYSGTSTTAIMNTRAFIFGIFSHALKLGGASKCTLICQLATNPYESYLYKDGDFTEVK